MHFNLTRLQAIFLLIANSLIFGVVCPAAGAGEELVIVLHEENPTVSMSHQDLTKVYLGKKTFYAHGEKIIPLDLSSQKVVFYEQYLKKPYRLITQYWTKAIFSGRGTPPREFKSTNSLLNFLHENPGGMAYLPDGSNMKSLKVLIITP